MRVAISVMKDGLRHPAQAQAVDGEHDLCLLRVDTRARRRPGAGAIRWRCATASKVVALGYTGGLGLSSSDGARWWACIRWTAAWSSRAATVSAPAPVAVP